METIQIIQLLKYIRANSSEEVHIEVGKEKWKIEWTENKSKLKGRAYVHQSGAARNSWETGRQRQSLWTKFIDHANCTKMSKLETCQNVQLENIKIDGR